MLIFLKNECSFVDLLNQGLYQLMFYKKLDLGDHNLRYDQGQA